MEPFVHGPRASVQCEYVIWAISTLEIEIEIGGPSP